MSRNSKSSTSFDKDDSASQWVESLLSIAECARGISVQDETVISEQSNVNSYGAGWPHALTQSLDADPWLWTIEHFPTIYHARASWLFDTNTESLQKAIFAGLRSLAQGKKTLEITVADIPGYQSGGVLFKFGVGNKDGFDILDEREVKRVVQRIEEKGTFGILDLVFHLHYSVDDGRRHKVHQDQYMARLAFQPGRVELLLHHLKGVRRIAPDEMVRILLSTINHELVRDKYPELELESLTSN